MAHFDVFFNSFAVSNTVKFSTPTFEKEEEQMHDWQILKALTGALTGLPDDGSTAEMILDMTLKSSIYDGLSLQKLLDNPHGIDLGPLKPCFQQRIKTSDGKIQLAPQLFLGDLPRLQEYSQQQNAISSLYPYKMIGRRLPRSHNTWTHNSYRLIKGKNQVTLQIHPEDAKSLGIENGEVVKVGSATGSVQIETEFYADMMPGVVSLPHGFGHQLRAGIQMQEANKLQGINCNDLTDDALYDQMSGNAALNGVPVSVTPA